MTCNGLTADRKQEYFHQELAANNGTSALWTNIVVTGGLSVTGNVYLTQSPENFTYDADGNLTNDGRWSYTWDAENRLTGMLVNTTVGPQYQLAFAYDPKGRRIQKLVVSNSVPIYTNRFLYDGWNLIATLDPQSSILQSFMWGTDLSGSPQGAGGVGGLLEVTYCGTTTNFVAFDGNGNVAALVNAADGTLAANYEYGPFGEVIRQTGPMAKANPFRFSTKYQDDESDLLYYGHRYYKPSTGTWLSRDPYGEAGGLNLYAAMVNNAVNLIDFYGLTTVEVSTQISGHSQGFDYSGSYGTYHDSGSDLTATIKATVNADCKDGKLSNVAVGPITGRLDGLLGNTVSLYLYNYFWTWHVKDVHTFDITQGTDTPKNGGCCSGIVRPINVHWYEDGSLGVIPSIPIKGIPIPIEITLFHNNTDVANAKLTLTIICCAGHLTVDFK